MLKNIKGVVEVVDIAMTKGFVYAQVLFSLDVPFFWQQCHHLLSKQLLVWKLLFKDLLTYCPL